ncbi:MAG: 30S ribosomal protein S9 [Bacteroidales bacterium]|jgi:small subunit ribosomal protein S9
MEIISTIGRRKTSVARIFMKEGTGKITVNGKDYKEYFAISILQARIDQPFELTNSTGKFDLKVNLVGGGISGQADALKLAISRALVKVNAENKPPLKASGLMTRDPRMVERKKPGQKKARKRFQFSKR